MAKKLERQVIEAGVVDTLSNIISKFFDTLFKGIDTILTADGGSVDKSENIKAKDGREGVKKYYTSGGGNKVELTAVYNDNKTCDVEISHDGGKDVVRKKNVRQNNLEKIVTDYMDKHDLGTNEGEDEITESTRLSVTLKKISASNEIHLCAINANYDIVRAMSDLETVVSDDEFADSLKEDEETSFDITTTDDSDEFDVNETDSVDTSACYPCICYSLMHTQNTMNYIRWGLLGPNRNSVIQCLNDLAWTLNTYIDVFANLSVEFCSIVPHPDNVQVPQDKLLECIEYNDGIDLAITTLESLISVVDGYYPNFPADVQSQVDCLIRTCKDKARRELPQYKE